MSEKTWGIESISLYPEWLIEVVGWHHSEWLRNADDCTEPHISEALIEREEATRQHLLADATPSTFIAHNESRPLGSVSLIDYPSSRDPTRVWLTNLYVDLPFQGLGIGSELLAYAEQFASKNNIPELSLYTFDASDYYLQRKWVWLSKGQLHGREVDVFSKRIQKSP